MSRTKCFDLTATNVAREMNLHRDSDPLTDPTFRRHIGRVTSDAERKAQTERLRPAASKPHHFRRFAAALSLLLLSAAQANAWTPRITQAERTPDGTRQVEIADFDRQFVFELWQTRSTANATRSRVGHRVDGAKDVMRFQVTPDSSRAVWIEIDTAHGGTKLYASPWTSSSTLLSSGLAEVRGFTIMCDSQHASLTGAILDGGRGQDFCVALTGGPVTPGWCALPDCRTIFTDGFESGTSGDWQ